MSGVVFLCVTHCICGLCVSRGRGPARAVGVVPAVAALRIAYARMVCL